MIDFPRNQVYQRVCQVEVVCWVMLGDVGWSDLFLPRPGHREDPGWTGGYFSSHRGRTNHPQIVSIGEFRVLPIWEKPTYTYDMNIHFFIHSHIWYFHTIYVYCIIICTCVFTCMQTWYLYIIYIYIYDHIYLYTQAYTYVYMHTTRMYT